MENVNQEELDSYFLQSVHEFRESTTFRKLESAVSNSPFTAEIREGKTTEGKLVYYGISVALKNANGDVTLNSDGDGYLCAYGYIAIIKKERIQYMKWYDDGFIEDVEAIIDYLKGHCGTV